MVVSSSKWFCGLAVGQLFSFIVCSHCLAQDPFASYYQKLIQDSLQLDLRIPETNSHRSVVAGVEDCRGGTDSRVVAIDEVKHFNFIPVDQRIYLKQPLDQMISQLFRVDSLNHKEAAYLKIQHFELEKRSRFLFCKQYCLHALICVGIHEETNSFLPKGELMYDLSHTRFFIGGSLKKGYKGIIESWLSAFPDDIASVQKSSQAEVPLPYHFRLYDESNPWMQLCSSVDFMITARSYLIDAQMYFVYPEVSQLFWEGARVLRYRHQKTFESIEWGLINGSIKYRLNPTWISGCRFNLFLGINRWKNMNHVDHKLYDAVISDFSIMQNIYYHPRNVRTLTWGLGLFQSISYVYSEKFNFEAGITLHVGMQL